MTTKLFSALLAALLIAGCASGPNPADVPVTDLSGKPVAGGTDGAQSSGVNTGGVTASELTGGVPQVNASAAPVAAEQGPAGVSRLVYFDFDSYAVKPEFLDDLQAHAEFIKRRSTSRVLIEGHTDDRGGREYNLALGQKRADAVQRALKQLGVATPQTEAVSFGKEKPAVEGGGEEAQAQNRRAVLVYR